MKLLVFAYVVAVILQDYGTLQDKPIAQWTSSEQVEVFKHYALNLVLAAIRPLRDHTAVTEGGCECISATDNDNLSLTDIILDTTCMAKNYETDLEFLQNTSEPDVSKLEINPELLVNIRRILSTLETPPEKRGLAFMDEMVKKYILKYKRNQSDTDTQISEEEVKLAMKCHKTIASLGYGSNYDYFTQLYHGFEAASALMRDDVENPKNTPLLEPFNSTIDEISKHQLRIPDDDYIKKSFETAIEKLNEKESDWNPEFLLTGA